MTAVGRALSRSRRIGASPAVLDMFIARSVDVTPPRMRFVITSDLVESRKIWQKLRIWQHFTMLQTNRVILITTFTRASSATVGCYAGGRLKEHVIHHESYFWASASVLGAHRLTPVTAMMSMRASAPQCSIWTVSSNPDYS